MASAAKKKLVVCGGNGFLGIWNSKTKSFGSRYSYLVANMSLQVRASAKLRPIEAGR
jgi:hypothetical protein